MPENKYIFSPQLSFTIDPTGDSGELLFEGDIGIRTVEELTKAFQDSLELIQTCRLDLSNITGIDLAGIQLIYSAHKTAESQGKKLILAEKKMDVFFQAVKEAGFSEVDWLEFKS